MTNHQMSPIDAYERFEKFSVNDSDSFSLATITRETAKSARYNGSPQYSPMRGARLNSAHYSTPGSSNSYNPANKTDTDQLQTQFWDQQPQIIISVVGNRQTGKSSLIEAISKLYLSKVTQNLQGPYSGLNTLDIRFVPINRALPQTPYLLRLVEVPESMIVLDADDYSLPDIIFQSDGTLLCYDITNTDSFIIMPGMLETLDKRSVIMLGCKADIHDSHEMRIEFKLGARLSNVFYVPFREISAFSNMHAISEVLEELFVIIMNGNEKEPRAKESKYVAVRKELKRMRTDPDLLSQNATLQSQRHEKNEPTSPKTQFSLKTKVNNLSSTLFGQQSPTRRKSFSDENMSQIPQNLNLSPSSVSTGDSVGSSSITMSRIPSQTNYPKSPMYIEDLRSNPEFIGPMPPSVGFHYTELIERITSAEYQDLEFTYVFLMIYRKFMKPSELLDRLIIRFESVDFDDFQNEFVENFRRVQIRHRYNNFLNGLQRFDLLDISVLG
ncbi:hypothetical protein HK096_004069 [Nowakowskiella sp. JEL0078]|nr:hypothetical protein HK096_004069 [Nowakowskiella sp. JEL0078]